MKAYKKIFMALGVVSIILALNSCDKNFDEINDNPNKPSTVSTPGILTNLQREIAVKFGDTWAAFRLNGIPCQHWTQRPYTAEDLYEFGTRVSTIEDYFNDTYIVNELGVDIAKLVDKDPMMAAYGDPIAQKATAVILKAFLIQQNAELFGDVPYTQANNLVEFIKPKYDTQADIFKGLIAELKVVNTDLKTGPKGWTTGDIIFKGDMEKWRKFANSLRLRLAMRMSNIESELSKTEAEAAIIDGVMDSNADNAIFKFIAIGSPNQAPFYGEFLERVDFAPTWQFTNLLAGKNDDPIEFVNPFNGIVDPRGKQFFLSPNEIAAEISTGVANNRIEGMPYGLTDADNASVWFTINTNDKTAMMYPLTAEKTNAQLPKPLWPNAGYTYLDYTNVALFIAEHKDNNKDYFKKGVEASLQMWGVPNADAATYVADVLAKFDAANADGKLEMIITQKYIHNFSHLSQEAYSEYRRTEYPKSLVLPGKQTGRTYRVQDGVNADGSAIYTDKNFLFEPMDLSHGDRIIDRMSYPACEFTSNGANVNAAIGSMGSDAQNAPLWWSLAYKKK